MFSIKIFCFAGTSLDEPKEIRYFINEHIRTQVQFRGTIYSTLSDE